MIHEHREWGCAHDTESFYSKAPRKDNRIAAKATSRCTLTDGTDVSARNAR